MSVVSLERLALHKIARDIKLWCQDVTDSDFNRYLYVLGPFDCFDSQLIQELINILAKTKELRTSYLHTLLHSNLTSLDLSVCSSLVSDLVLRMVTTRCKNLKRLSLKGCTRLSTKALRDIPRNLQSLQDLDLSGCRACTDDLLHKLKEWCPDLLILKLESCTQVTDQGLEFLLGKAQPGCRKLLEVNVSSTSITDEGVALLMISLSDLRSLSSAGVTSSTGSSIAIPIPDCTKLNCLNLSYSSIADSNVKVITDKCPGLVDLSLACCGSLSAVCLHHITSLKHLRKLNIASMKANFLADFVPFLKASGSRLEILDISGMKGVDSKFFGLHCCLLQELMLTDCEDITGSFIKQTESGPLLSLTQACCSLRLLSLQGCSFSTSKPLKDHLSAILTNSSNLQFLDLSSNRDLEDEAIAHFVSSSKLGGLRGLNLAHCLHITFEAMKPVVEKCRNLALLDLSHCRNISLREVESLKKTAGKRLGILWV